MSRRTQLALGAIAVGALLLASLPAAAAQSPAGVATSKWGWITVRNPTSSYTPATRDRGNSAGMDSTVTYMGAGEYRVTFEGIGDDGGVAHVSAFGTKQRTCLIEEWGSGGGDEGIDVSCFNKNGTPAAARFTASFLAVAGADGELGYFWADHPNDDYDISHSYNYNAADSPNHVTRNSAGNYTVTMGNIGHPGGNVQVTAHGGVTTAAGQPAASPAGIIASTCNLLIRQEPVSGDEVMTVQCRDLNGVPADSRFSISFVGYMGLKGPNNARVAYLWANKATNASYTPHPSYHRSTAEQPPHVTRQSTGRYEVTLPGMLKGGSAQVTAHGANARRCQVSSIRTAGLPQRVGVRCYNGSGDPANSKFSLSYER